MKVRSLITLIAASLALMLIGIISAQETSPRVWLSSDMQQVTTGQAFTVTINVADAVGVYGGSFKLAYDPQALEVVLADNKAVVPGAFFNASSNFTLANTANGGIVEYAMTLTQPAEPVSGGGVLGTVTFRALSNAPVDITPIEARLLSPEFSEVDGRKVAQKINEVTTLVEGMTINAGTTQIIVEEPKPELRPLTVEEMTPSTLPITTPPSIPAPRLVDRRVLVIGSALFILGLLLFATSIGVYVNLRRQFLLQEQSEQLIW
jgi:Cohesin domain